LGEVIGCVAGNRVERELRPRRERHLVPRPRFRVGDVEPRPAPIAALEIEEIAEAHERVAAEDQDRPVLGVADRKQLLFFGCGHQPPLRRDRTQTAHPGDREALRYFGTASRSIAFRRSTSRLIVRAAAVRDRAVWYARTRS